MSMLRTITAAGALAVMATGAFAGSITWDGSQSAFTDVSISAAGAATSSPRAGALKMTDAGNSIVTQSLGSTNWLAWCLDLMTTVKANAEYHLTDTPYTGAPVTTGQQNTVRALFEGNFGSVAEIATAAANPTLSAAFQVALWEGFYDVASFNLNAGNFKLNTAGAVATAAQGYIAGAIGWINSGFNEPNKFVLHFLEGSTPQGVRSQNLVTVTDAPAPIPLPAAGWLLLTAIGGLAVARRRKT
jgi:hypothetical protein